MKSTTCITIDLDSLFQNSHFQTDVLDFNYEKELKTFCRNTPPCTLFARVDQQISERFYWNYNFCIANQSRCADDEIGWHPHIFDFKNQKQIKDEATLVEKLQEVYENSDVGSMSSFRMGNCQGGDLIYKWLSDKFSLSSSAMACCKRKDSIRYYDWSQTGNLPYFPSKTNYQITGEQCWKVVEVPLTTIPVKTCYDTKKKSRVINLSYKEEIFRKSLIDALEVLKKLPVIVIAMHAEELVEGLSNDLYDYGTKNCLQNLEFFNECLQPEYKTMRDWWSTSPSNKNLA